MKKAILPFIYLMSLLLLCGCGYAEPEPLEPWPVPSIDAAPGTPTPTVTPPPPILQTVWNRAEDFNMSSPGVSEGCTEEQLTHKKCMSLFPWRIVPDRLFSAPDCIYKTLELQKTEHSVFLDENGALAENAYVEYLYLPEDGSETDSIKIMAELCSREQLLSSYEQGICPHFSFPEGSRPKYSKYRLDEFLLVQLNEDELLLQLALQNPTVSASRQADSSPVLLTVSCGSGASPEQLIYLAQELISYRGN